MHAGLLGKCAPVISAGLHNQAISVGWALIVQVYTDGYRRSDLRIARLDRNVLWFDLD